MSQQTITINGTIYDAHTGLPVDKEAVSVSATQVFNKPKAHHSHNVHQRTQKSHTLNRKVVKQIAAAKAAQQQARAQKSPAITKFAPHPAGVTKPRTRSLDIGPTVHPLAQKAHQQMAAKPQQASHPHVQKPAPVVKATPKPSAVIKQEAEKEALDKAPSHHAAGHKQHRAKSPRKAPRVLSIASASLALLLLGGYFTYLNMPNLSVRVAAAQAGIEASYPSYRPDGYRLNGPVAFNDGQVSMKFAANAGPQNFTITQSKTSWDSTAVKENYVEEKWGDDYMPYAENGLSIYAHDGEAAWVNNGILYTISGDAPLSASQIRGIATSM